jgi:hypothetical protein
VDAAAGADDQFLAAHQQRGRRTGQPGNRAQRAAIGFEHTGLGRHQHPPVERFGDRLHVQRRVQRRVGGRHAGKAVVRVHRQALVGADPQPPATVHVQRLDQHAGQFRQRFRLECGEARTVEARQAGLGTDPQVAVGVLGQRGDRDLRQALLDRPGVLDVVVEGLVDVQRGRRRRRRQCRHGGHRHHAAACAAEGGL